MPRSANGLKWPNRRGGRVVEGAPLLRAYGSKAHRGFESLPLRQPDEALVEKSHLLDFAGATLQFLKAEGDARSATGDA